MKETRKVFLLDDDDLIISMLSRALKKAGFDVKTETESGEAMQKINSFNPDVVLLDIKMPKPDGMEILREIQENRVDSQVVMLTSLTKPFNTDEVKIVINNVIEKERLKQEVQFLRKAYSEFVEKDFIGRSEAVRSLLEKVDRIARARVSSILITGESGTGKEVLARHIHNLMFEQGGGGHAPFVSVNCAAMPESLLESELFGHIKGSFTDAKSDKKGLFELASGGSILLDEIGEMKMGLQSKLLRVVEDRTIRRIGGKSEMPIDATVIATTNKNLSEAVSKGEFRKDLFFRLSTFYLHIVPLRERSEDIALLADHFLNVFTTKYNNRRIKGFTPEAEQVLASASWPGNVRELKNLIERIVVLENAEMIGPEHIPSWITGGTMSDGSRSDNGFQLPDEGIDLEEMEKKLILQALEKADYNKTLAAKLLNISYDSLRYQVKKFGLD